MANTKSLYNFSFGNATHVGLVRQANEDYFGNFETKNGYVFLVCDGMGGHAGGAKASQIAVSVIKDCLQQTDYNSPYEALSQSITSANQAILNYAQNNPELTGMGTTCVAVLIIGSDVYYAHVGDSRIYLFSNKKLIKITKDHSFVQNMVDLGAMTEDEAEKHPRKNEITNALGLKNMNPPTVCASPIKAAKGDMFLLCSDGLTGMVHDNDIESVLKNKMELQAKANHLVDLANTAGGKDNVTVQIVGITQSPYKKTMADIPIPTENQRKAGKNNILLFSLIGVFVLLAGTTLVFRKKIFPNEKQLVIDSTKLKIDTIKTDSINKNKIDTTLGKK